MNSADDVKQNGILRDDIRDDLPSTSQVTNSDSNANVNTTITTSTIDQSKGAIPKTKILKKSVKINNNVEDNNMTSVLKRMNSVSNNYLNNCLESDNNSEQFNNSSDVCCSSNNLDFRHNYDDDYYSKSYVPLVTSTSFPEQTDCTGISCYRNQLTLQIKKDSDSSSDENELLSVSDDGCIYTYKGDNVADLPRSFFNLEIPPIDNIDNVIGENREELSSPEMDFLEMDFDPGPSGDADSDSSSNPDVETTENLPLDSVNSLEQSKPCCSKYLDDALIISNKTVDIPKNNTKHFVEITPEPIKAPTNFQEPAIDIKLPWSCKLSERTRRKSPRRKPNRIVFGNTCTSNCDFTRKKTVVDSIEKIMIWSEQETAAKQITQIGTSLCGATAILNVLNALNYPLPTNEKVQEFISTKFRANSSPLTEYLLSRSVAGCNHRDLILGLYKSSEGRIYSRFFAMYPERVVNLYKWLGYWIKNGAVPIACLNLQKCEDGTEIPDSWHHQMIYGVGPKGIYLTNPLECLDGSDLWPQLSSESVLLIRTNDVLSRLNPKVDFQELMKISDTRWRELNVVGQIAKLVRETRKIPRTGSTVTSHIKIPADYKSGIILAIDKDSSAFTLLHQCPELPLLEPNSVASAF